MDILKFKQDLKQVIRDSAKQIEGQEGVFQFGIKTDGDIITLLICYNTVDHYKQKKNSTLEKYGILYSEARWNMDEWFNEELGEDGELLDQLNRALNEHEFDKDEMLDLFRDCLLETREEGVFDAINKDIILYIDETDGWFDQEMIDRMRLLIPDDEMFQIFVDECVDVEV